MKRIITLLLVVICATTTSFAQEKGDKYWGGNVGIGSATTIIDGSSSSSISVSIQPEIGYFVANNFKIGASAGYDYNIGSHYITVTPNIAYYAKISENFYYTPGLEFGFVLGVANDFVMPGFGFGVSLGRFEFRPKPKFGLSVDLLSLSYISLSYTNSDYGFKITSNSFSFNLIVNPTVSLKYYF